MAQPQSYFLLASFAFSVNITGNAFLDHVGLMVRLTVCLTKGQKRSTCSCKFLFAPVLFIGRWSADTSFECCGFAGTLHILGSTKPS